MAKKFNFREYLDIGNISANWFYQNFGFVLFSFFLILLYIANAHYAENKVKKIQVMQREIKELRWEYMSIQSRIMQNTTQSELSKDVNPTGLNLTSARKPYRIMLE